ncbi:MAG: hypothetical protein R2939_16590 [Kofleriaceae bacterium]
MGSSRALAGWLLVVSGCYADLGMHVLSTHQVGPDGRGGDLDEGAVDVSVLVSVGVVAPGRTFTGMLGYTYGTTEVETDAVDIRASEHLLSARADVPLEPSDDDVRHGPIATVGLGYGKGFVDRTIPGVVDASASGGALQVMAGGGYAGSNADSGVYAAATAVGVYRRIGTDAVGTTSAFGGGLHLTVSLKN